MNHHSRISVAALSDTGLLRKRNEDTYMVATDLSEGNWKTLHQESNSLQKEGLMMMVADGMGGMEAGEIASALAVQAVEDFFRGYENLPFSEHGRSTFLSEAIRHAHRRIAAAGKSDPEQKKMGTTAVLAWVSKEKAHLAWCGDSRAYRYRPGEGLKLLTNDHAWVWEKVLQGELTPEQARLHPDSNIITQSLGDEAYPPAPDTMIVSLDPGDRLMLCSDGLSGMLSNPEMERILDKGLSPNQSCRLLVDAANEAGGDDNITVTMVEIVKEENGQHIYEDDSSFQHIKGKIKNWLIK